MTNLFRRVADGWKVFLRHADPLAKFRWPEVVLPPGGELGSKAVCH